MKSIEKAVIFVKSETNIFVKLDVIEISYHFCETLQYYDKR